MRDSLYVDRIPSRDDSHTFTTAQAALSQGILLNDSQSKLNSTRVQHLACPNSVDEIIGLIWAGLAQ